MLSQHLDISMPVEECRLWKSTILQGLSGSVKAVYKVIVSSTSPPFTTAINIENEANFGQTIIPFLRNSFHELLFDLSGTQTRPIQQRGVSRDRKTRLVIKLAVIVKRQ